MFRAAPGHQVKLKDAVRTVICSTDDVVLVFCQAKDTEIRGTRFVITGLKTGGQYRFRVMAYNIAGNSEPGEVPEVLEVNDRTSESCAV